MIKQNSWCWIVFFNSVADGADIAKFDVLTIKTNPLMDRRQGQFPILDLLVGRSH